LWGEEGSGYSIISQGHRLTVLFAHFHGVTERAGSGELQEFTRVKSEVRPLTTQIDFFDVMQQAM
tara:strand:+ start:1057 stop:1251 length:195 start_codon:yes stop_codon:yes gene_type:complete